MDLQQIEQQVLGMAQEMLLPMVEVAVKKEIEAESDKVVDFLLAEIEKLHPPAFVDGMLAAQAPAAKVALKAFLLQQADKISDKV